MGGGRDGEGWREREREGEVERHKQWEDVSSSSPSSSFSSLTLSRGLIHSFLLIIISLLEMEGETDRHRQTKYFPSEERFGSTHFFLGGGGGFY